MEPHRQDNCESYYNGRKDVGAFQDTEGRGSFGGHAGSYRP